MADREDPPRRQVGAPRPDGRPRTAVIAVHGPVAPDGAPRPCDLVRGLLDGGFDVIVCDVGSVVTPDLATVDALARLALTARRSGGAIHLRGVSPRLGELIALVGMDDLLPGGEDLRFEARGQAEEREDPLGVEEVVHPDDATG